MANTQLDIFMPTILKHYSNSSWQAVSVTVSDAGVTPDTSGRKVIQAGTIVGGNTQPVLLNRNEPVVEKNDADAEGVLLHAVDVTNGPAPAAMVIQGFIDLGKIPNEPSTAAIEALKMIQFMK